MIRVIQGEDGAVYASSDNEQATVDEVIEFLLQHRGKMFWNGAAGDVSFYVTDTRVSCDCLSFILERFDAEESVCTFFEND